MSTRKRALLIANPGARQGQWLLEPARQAFADAGAAVEVVVTEAPGHGGRVAREQAGNYDAVFTLGGDGTAMEVVQALMGTDHTVGILAGGTGNLLARALRVPLDVRKAVPALLHGDVKRMDLGVLSDGRAFAIGVGAGVNAEMVAGAADVGLRRTFGILAYFASATKSIVGMKTFHVRATVDGRTIERDECIDMMIVNMGSVFDGLLQLGPNISHDDGQLDLCLFSASNLMEAAIVAGRFALKDFTDKRHMEFASGRDIRVETTPVRSCQADGELLGKTPISATVAPLAAPLLVPRHRD